MNEREKKRNHERRKRRREEKIYPGIPSKWMRKNLIRTRIMKPKPEERRWKKVRKGQREKSMNTNRINSNRRAYDQQRAGRNWSSEIREDGRNLQEMATQLRRLTNLLEGRFMGGKNF